MRIFYVDNEIKFVFLVFYVDLGYRILIYRFNLGLRVYNIMRYIVIFINN